MSDGQPDSPEAVQRSWLDRLSKAFTGSEPRNRQELIGSLREARQRGLIDADALTMIEGVLEVTEMQVRDIMIPRAQMVVVERDASLAEILPILTESQHSRFPVIGENKDEVLGILLAKDLLPYLANEQRGEEFNIRDILRPAAFVPEQASRYAAQGIPRQPPITSPWWSTSTVASTAWSPLRTCSSEIVGEIADEHDRRSDLHHEARRAALYGQGADADREFNDYFQADFADEEFDTIGGLLMCEFGRLPRRGRRAISGVSVSRCCMPTGRRLHLLQVTPLAGEAVGEGGVRLRPHSDRSPDGMNRQ